MFDPPVTGMNVLLIAISVYPRNPPETMGRFPTSSHPPTTSRVCHGLACTAGMRTPPRRKRQGFTPWRPSGYGLHLTVPQHGRPNQTGTLFSAGALAVSRPHIENITMSIGTILVIVLVLMLLGSLPSWPHSRSWGYYPSGGLGLILVILVVLLLLGRI